MKTDYPEDNYPWAAGNLYQGMLVQYQNPHAKAPELCGRQLGVVISSNQFNSSGTTGIFVSPITMKELDANLSIKLPLETGVSGFLRPELTETVSPEFCRLTPIPSHGDHIILPKELVQSCIERLVKIITPRDTKPNAPRRNGMPRYGEMLWFKEFPRYDDNVMDASMALCLTPSDIWKKTGIGLFLRSHANINRYSPRYNVLVEAQGSKPVFFNALLVRALAPIRRFSDEENFLRIRVTLRPEILQEITNKTHGALDYGIYEQNVQRYPGRPGELPPGFGAGAAHHELG